MKFNKVSPPCRIIDCDVADWVPDAGSEGHARVPRHPRSRAHRVPEGPGQLACGRLVHRRVAHVEDVRAGQTFHFDPAAAFTRRMSEFFGTVVRTLTVGQRRKRA